MDFSIIVLCVFIIDVLLGWHETKLISAAHHPNINAAVELLRRGIIFFCYCLYFYYIFIYHQLLLFI